MTETNLQTTEELEQEELTTPADGTEYTYDKQQLDQERANTRRAREELASVSESLESERGRVENLENELEQLKSANKEEKARLEAEKQAEQAKLEAMDPDLVDPQVIKNIQALKRQLESQSQNFNKEKSELTKQLKAVSEKAAVLERERADAQAKAEHDKAVNSVLDEVEDTLKTLHNVTTPGQYRTEAMKMADDLVDRGERKKPGNILEGVKLMRECYLKVISAHTKKKGVSVDGGKSGVTAGVKSSDEIKSGSLSDVKAQMLKNKSWRD